MFAYLFCRAYPVFFPVSFFCIVPVSFLFRIKFHHFSVPDRTITRCLGKFLSYFLRFLLLLFHAFVQNFLEFVQNRIFFVQKPEEIPACFFWTSRIFFYSGFRIFWGAFPAFLSERVRFSHLPIRFFKRVFYLVGYDSLVSFPSVCSFLRLLSIKNLFFQNEPSFLICIYSLFVWIFSYFFGCYGRFFCPVSYPFLHFSVRLRKNLLLFFIRIIRFLRFFRFVGIIFPAFSRVELRNFSARFDIFCASPEFFQRKNPYFPE